MRLQNVKMMDLAFKILKNHNMIYRKYHQKIMGHSSITATLNNYVDVSEELKESELEKVYSYYRENMNIDIDDFD